jgi:1-hydroxycarotenoid 3,4-desaturase
MAMTDVVIIGAGMGGLSAAALLAARGLSVCVVEKEADVGGKIRRLDVAGTAVDAGPTVFTMRRLFEELFNDCGADFGSSVGLSAITTLARHAWPDGSQLDLFADRQASFDAIADFAGRADARAHATFSAESARIWSTLEDSFLRRQRTNPIGLTFRLGLARLPELQAVRPYESLWSALGRRFQDQRLVQLFGRYATYCGCSPFKAPATMMLISHLESAGVWRVDGGLHQVARAVAELSQRHGARFRHGTAVRRILLEHGRAAGVELATGERIAARRVIANCDPTALADGLFGEGVRRAVGGTSARTRSLSAVTWMLHAEAEGPPMAHHNVVFSADYPREFAEIGAGRLPADPTVYICAQDRSDDRPTVGPERLQIIVNAPATADHSPLSEPEIDRCESAMLNSLRSTGLSLRWTPDARVRVTPTDYAKLFPSTGGALYGRASHGALGSFLRPGSRTRIPGLYLAGGATHPGAGVPMAALSGRLASEALISDLMQGAPRARDSMSTSRPAAMPGGMSMPSPTMAASASPSLPSSARSSRLIT